MKNLEANAMGLKFKNPILAASGTFGFGEEFSEIYDLSILGGICSKGLTLNSRSGNKGIRLWETPMGLMNSIGLENPGVDKFIMEELPRMKTYNTIIFANLGGHCEEDYFEGIYKLNDTNVDAVELNISCPNVKSGGMAFGVKSSVAYEIVSRVRKICKKPLMVKLSPNAENIPDMAVACEAAGADAISLINTIQAMAIDIKNKKAVFENVYAGLSGPCVKPIALRMVHEAAKMVNIPICGLGGIMTAIDVIEFIMAGATLVQIGTANFIKPDIAIDIINDLKEFIDNENIKSLEEIRGII
ncbi:MAG: dihydroorotate dehydrogenase [Tissierellia bacterium]|jgi:dihydroorotate dehydrogenase (NAD+) catalytic subunit|nr:dihydroorotate dehydrogenase [Tissierellia bacterium]MDD3225934.1 dihydroorotate dehydrogenase [Tissierellia bacterium]MDD3750868.1 dihydroorotate dehydrogenase [Tissierellia bacterium]MDD4045861.1 dihydroorotate dehydrogenase [Tissierellia bacterium]MDD4678021.1 dihydroorotate dehydrogenase [Tissierellia bacterium]